jgi:hypothetical protein
MKILSLASIERRIFSGIEIEIFVKRFDKAEMRMSLRERKLIKSFRLLQAFDNK